jgi:NADPH:quinone reductase-like Zn-dependent oxidoreductase
MKAIQYQAYGSYEENRLVEVDRPKPKDGEVLVKMSTVGINPLDNTFRSGHIYLATPANVPRVGGQTGAGVVVESRHPANQAGDRVFVGAMGWGLVTDGTWREYVAAPAAAISPIPANIDDDVAAAYLAGAGYLSGYLALTEFAKLQPGQTVLAPAIGSAVGMETLQVARHLGASMTISTASTTQKAKQARAGYGSVVSMQRHDVSRGELRPLLGVGKDHLPVAYRTASRRDRELPHSLQYDGRAFLVAIGEHFPRLRHLRNEDHPTWRVGYRLPRPA